MIAEKLTKTEVIFNTKISLVVVQWIQRLRNVTSVIKIPNMNLNYVFKFNASSNSNYNCVSVVKNFSFIQLTFSKITVRRCDVVGSETGNTTATVPIVTTGL